MTAKLSRLVSPAHGGRISPWFSFVTFLCGLLAVGLNSPTVAASTTHPTLSGTLDFGQLAISGQVGASFGADAAILLDALGTGNQTSNWTMKAERLTLNWTHHRRVGAGDSANDPNGSFLTHKWSEETDELVLVDADLTHRVDARLANQLLLVGTDSTGLLRTGGECFASAAEREYWWAGQGSNQTKGAAPTTLDHNYTLNPGDPVVRCPAAGITLQGSFRIFVWGGTVSGRASNQTVESRSGTWWEQPIGATPERPKGLVREEHAQLLRLTVINGTLTLRQSQGIAQAASDRLALIANGTVRIGQANGVLATQTIRHDLRNFSIELRGLAEIALARSQTASSRLEASLTASAVLLSDEGGELKSRRINPTLRSLSRVAPAKNNGALESLWLVPLALTLMALVGLGLRRLTPRPHPRALLAFATLRLLNHESKEAGRLARRLLQRYPQTPEALFVAATSLVQQGKNGEAIRLLRPSYRRYGKTDRATLAYVLAVAAARDGKTADAFDYLAEAASVQVLGQKALTEPSFAALARDVRFQRVTGASEALVAYS